MSSDEFKKMIHQIIFAQKIPHSQNYEPSPCRGGPRCPYAAISGISPTKL